MEAALDHLVYHENTPTFIAQKFISRFGISNPSPRYIESVARSFLEGKFISENSLVSFGSGNYGDIGAMVRQCVCIRVIIYDAKKLSFLIHSQLGSSNTTR